MEVMVKTKRTTVITIDADSVKQILIEKFAKGYDASVEFTDDVGDQYYIHDVRITYTEDDVA